MEEAARTRFELLAARFVAWLAAMNYSPKTRVNYGRDVRRFLSWVLGETEARSPSEITPAQVARYQMALYGEQRDGKPPSVGSQRGRLLAVRAFFAWLVEEQILALSPASSLKLPRRGRPLPRVVLSAEEARRLVERTPTELPGDVRDRAMLEVLYGTGIRLSELIGLSVYDVELQAATLRIEHGKGDATRMVPLTASAVAALRLYLEEARPKLVRHPSQKRLFVSRRSGAALYDVDVERVVRRAAERAGIDKRVTPHGLRHACATHLLSGGADIRQIQRLLGHRKLSSTEVYTHVEVSDLAEVVARCHPRARPKP